jgi:hypothetical protein
MKLNCPFSVFLVFLEIQSKRALPYLLAVLTLLAGVDRVTAQGTAFSYQGRLNESGAPANGNYDFAYNDPQSGSQVGATETNSAVTVTNGFFRQRLISPARRGTANRSGSKSLCARMAVVSRRSRRASP